MSHLRSKSALVDTIVDIIVSPLIDSLNFIFQIARQQVDFGELLWKQGVELVVQHTDNLAGLIADDPLLLLVV